MDDGGKHEPPEDVRKHNETWGIVVRVRGQGFHASSEKGIPRGQMSI